MSNIQGIPPTRTAIADRTGTATRPWYLFFQNIPTTLASQQAQIDALIAEGGSGGGGLPITSNVIGQNSILSSGTLASGIVVLNLQGDAGAPGNTFYYGTGPTGSKGFYSVASAFLGTAGDITLATAANGVTTIDLAVVTYGSAGTLQAITLDTFGRVVQTHAVTITGTANRVTVTNGTAAAGQPTIDIASTYVGQASITTLGTVTTGAWNATAIGPTFGGTGLTTYAAGDLLYASAANVLTNRSIGTTGQVLTVVGGIPTWATPAASGGTVTSITAGTGLAASPSNPITTAGTISLATRTAGTLMGNPTASSATPTDITIGTGLNLSVGGVLSASAVSPTQTINASENITAPAMVHIHTTGGTTTVRNASSVNSARPARGFILTSVLSGNPAAVFSPGQTISGFPAATLTGDNVYLATTSVGAPSNTPALASGNLLQRVGTPISDTSFIFDPDDGIVMP